MYFSNVQVYLHTAQEKKKIIFHTKTEILICLFVYSFTAHHKRLLPDKLTYMIIENQERACERSSTTPTFSSIFSFNLTSHERHQSTSSEFLTLVLKHSKTWSAASHSGHYDCVGNACSPSCSSSQSVTSLVEKPTPAGNLCHLY